MLTNIAFVFICVRASSALVRTSAFLQPVVRGQVYIFEISPPLVLSGYAMTRGDLSRYAKMMGGVLFRDAKMMGRELSGYAKITGGELFRDAKIT